MQSYAFNSAMRNKNWNTARQFTCFSLGLFRFTFSLPSLLSLPRFRISLCIKHFYRGFVTRLGLAALICRYLTVRRLSVTAGHKGGIVEVAWPRGCAARVAGGEEG